MNSVTTMTTAELIAEYNALTGKSIKKFSSRAAGEKQLTQARVLFAPKAPSTPSEPNDARTTRHRVRVDGREYRSVREAFEQLNLPLGRHIKFRARLKAAGRLDFDGVAFEIVEA